MYVSTNQSDVLIEKSWERVDAMSTRLLDVASTIRATIFKQGERNIIQNILNGNGYEGIIEVWRRNDSNRNN